NTIDLKSMNDLISPLVPEFLLPKLGYLNEAYAESRALSKAGVNWYITGSELGLKYALSIIIIILYLFNKKEIFKVDTYKSLLSFIFLFADVSNILSLIPSGFKFLTITYFLIIVLILLLLQNKVVLHKLKLFLFLSIPLFLLYIIVEVRSAFDVIGINFIF